jgi:putative transcriptional regulator
LFARSEYFTSRVVKMPARLRRRRLAAGVAGIAVAPLVTLILGTACRPAHARCRSPSDRVPAWRWSFRRHRVADRLRHGTRGGDRGRARTVRLASRFLPIVVKLDVVLADRKVKSKDLAEYIGINRGEPLAAQAGQVKGVRFETLLKICEYLECQPGDILVYKEAK